MMRERFLERVLHHEITQKKIETKFGNSSKPKNPIVFVTQTRRLISSSSCMKKQQGSTNNPTTILHGWSKLRTHT
jgi:hypothetical protein